MSKVTVNISVDHKGQKLNAVATRMRISAHRLFAFDDGADDIRILELVKNRLEAHEGTLAFYGGGRFFDYLLKHFPSVRSTIRCMVADDPKLAEEPSVTVDNLPSDIRAVFFSETLTAPRMSMKARLPENIETLDIEDILSRADWKTIPKRAWKEAVDSIYPFDLPDIRFLHNQDLILIDCPSRNMAFMPNGLGYVHNALKKTNIRFQTLDLDILVYHRFHIHRIFDSSAKTTLPSGKEIPEDPWQAENYDFWQDPDATDLFRADIDEITAKLVLAKPKILGLSIQACNIHFSREIVKKVKELLPDTIILVGGYSCYQETIGRLAFPESDYMMIGEADLTIGPLVEKLAAGERPENMPGVMSRHDAPNIAYKQANWPQNLDELEFPKYEWYDLNVYRNHNHYLLTPIIASRGCRWSQCSFCAERFQWRIRSPKNVVDEFEWLADHGCDLFMFNESDLNGMPETLIEICDEILRRKLKIRLTGQLRIHKKSDRIFFDKLHSAGFVSLRFGVDAWAKNTLRLQKKGYTLQMIRQNLKACHSAGINTEVNTVIGVPGETDDDIKETIDLQIECKQHIDKIANINPLMLMVGSIYWNEPEKHNIHFKEDKREIYKKHLHLIPRELWYSQDPYIDGSVQKERFIKIVEELGKNGLDIGDFAKQVIKDVKEGRGAESSARPGAKKDVQTKSDSKAAIDNDETSLDDGINELRLFEFDGGVYRLDGENDLLNVTDGADTVSMTTTNKYLAMARYVASECAGLVQKPQNVKHIGKKILRHIKVAGAKSLLDVVSNKIRMSRTVGKLTVNADANIRMVRDQVYETQLILEGYHGYNIIKVGGDYYGVKHGYSFDYDLAVSGGYPGEALVKSRLMKDVKSQIARYASN